MYVNVSLSFLMLLMAMFVVQATTWCQCRVLKHHWTSVPSSCLTERPPLCVFLKRFYLIGGGIPIIVCGITAAANIKNYGSRTNAP